MEKAKHSVRFEAEVDGQGRITFSTPVPELGLRPGAKVTVNIVGGVLSRRLTALGVTEEEIGRIGDVQLEDRDHVISFLSSQGALKKNKRFSAAVRRGRS
ncbi:MAG: hypothetical protein HUU02_01040 [Bacteroidetes bacterium]|nr:hypothetical protein [Bacteroidota bacterium]